MFPRTTAQEKQGKGEAAANRAEIYHYGIYQRSLSANFHSGIFFCHPYEAAQGLSEPSLLCRLLQDPFTAAQVKDIVGLLKRIIADLQIKLIYIYGNLNILRSRDPDAQTVNCFAARGNATQPACTTALPTNGCSGLDIRVL